MRSSDRQSGDERRVDTGPQLTPREREVLALVLRGEQNKVIALRLGVVEQSVKQHVSDLLRKFGVPNRAALGEAGAHLDLVGPALLERISFPQLFRNASVLIAVTRGPDHLYVAVNQAFAKSVGQRDVVGQTMREAFPELEDSGYFDVADRVYQTGESFVAHGGPGGLGPWCRGRALVYRCGVTSAARRRRRSGGPRVLRHRCHRAGAIAVSIA